MAQPPNRPSNPPATATPMEPAIIDRDLGVPPGLSYWAIVVGLILALVGGATILVLALYFVGAGSAETMGARNLAALMTCVGFGIILAAFGARAGGTWRGLSIAGGGALAIALFVLYHKFPGSEPAKFTKRGQISGNLHKVADMRIIDENPQYMYRDATTRTIRFVFLNQRFKNGRLKVHVDVDTNTDAAPDEPEFFEMWGDGRAIAKRYFNNPDIEVIKWTFDFDAKQIKDGDTVIFEQPSQTEESQITIGQTGSMWRPSLGLVSAAFARSGQGFPSTAEVINDLTSKSVSTRRNARDELVSRGPDVVVPLMQAFRQNPNVYRIKLGAVYSLTGMLRRDLSLNKEIANRLTDEDIELLAATASDPDKTVRLLATEFLFNLKDNRVAAPSLKNVTAPKSASGVYNSILILKSVFPQLKTPQQRDVTEKLRSSVPTTSKRTRDLIDAFAK